MQAGYHDEALFKEHYGEEIESSLEELWSFSRERSLSLSPNSSSHRRFGGSEV